MSTFKAGHQYLGDPPDIEKPFDDAESARAWLAQLMREDAALTHDGAQIHETPETIGPVLDLVKQLQREADEVAQGFGLYDKTFENRRYFVEEPQ